MNKTAEQMEKDPLSRAIRAALIQVAVDEEILRPFYHRRAGESDEALGQRLNEYSKLSKEEIMRLAKEYQKGHSLGK